MAIEDNRQGKIISMMGKIKADPKEIKLRSDALVLDNEVDDFTTAARKSINLGQFEEVEKEMAKLVGLGKNRDTLIASIEAHAIRIFTLSVKNFLNENAPQAINPELDKYVSIGIDRKKLEEVVADLQIK